MVELKILASGLKAESRRSSDVVEDALGVSNWKLWEKLEWDINVDIDWQDGISGESNWVIKGKLEEKLKRDIDVDGQVT